MADEIGESGYKKPYPSIPELKEIAGDWLSRFENHPAFFKRQEKRIEETPAEIKQMIQHQLRKRPLSDSDIDKIAHHFTQQNNEETLLEMITNKGRFMEFFVSWTPEQLTDLIDKTAQYTVRRTVDAPEGSDEEEDAKEDYIKALKTIQGMLHPE